jgi:hypothetical protein
VRTKNATVEISLNRIKNFITVMQNEINKTAKVVVGCFILSILTDLCCILPKRHKSAGIV